MSDSKYRTPIPAEVKESQKGVVDAAISLGQEIEKHKQKEKSKNPEGFWANELSRISELVNLDEKKPWWKFWEKK